MEDVDPSDALRAILADRERARRAVYKQAMAREAAEEAQTHAEKLLRMQVEDAQKLALENAALRRQLEETTGQLTRTEKYAEEENRERIDADRRVERLETVISRIQDALATELPDIWDSVFSTLPPGPVADDGPVGYPLGSADSGGRAMDPHEGPHGPLVAEEVADDGWVPARSGSNEPYYDLEIPWARVKARVKAFVKKPLVLATALASPFYVATLFNILMLFGVKVQSVADFLVPYWQPWMGSFAVSVLVATAPALIYTVAYLKFTEPALEIETGEEPVEAAGDSPLSNVPATDETPSDAGYIAQLREIFGEDDDEGTGAGHEVD